MIDQVAGRLKKSAPVMLRVNLNIGKKGSRMASVGVPSQFGIDEEQLADVISQALQLPNVKLLGLHTYQGTQNFHLDFYRESIPRMFELVRTYMHRYGIRFSSLGLGGGFGVPYFVDDEPFPINEYGQLLSEQVRLNEDLGLNFIFIESGRYITSRMGYYVTSVLYTKSSYGKPFVIVDGGTHQRAFSTVLGGRSFKEPLPVKLIRAGEQAAPDHEEEVVKVTLAGKLCTPTDILQSNVAMPSPRPDDLIVFVQSGAYGLTCGNVHFLSHSLAKEIMIYPDESFRDISWLTSKVEEEAEFV